MAKEKIEYPPEADFLTVQNRAKGLIKRDIERDKLLAGVDKMIRCDWSIPDKLETKQWMKEVIETAPRDASETAAKALAEELALATENDDARTRTRALELEMTRKDGSTIWTEIKGNFLLDEGGRPGGARAGSRMRAPMSRIAVFGDIHDEQERLVAALDRYFEVGDDG